MPEYAKLSTAECNAIHIAREYAPDAARKAMKREVFSRAKVHFGIPPNHRLVVETDVQVAGHGTLKNKQTRETYELNEHGRWVGAENGTSAKLWFKLPADEVVQAISDALDNVDANGDAIARSTAQPVGTKVIDGTEDKLIVASNGDVWLWLDADSYDPASERAEPEPEHEEDEPY